MYIEITGTDSPVISKFEQERDIYVGDYYSTPIKIKWTRLTNSYITVSYENSRHMKFGPLYADFTEANGTSVFNITNPRILIPGDLHISIFINVSNDDGKTIKRYAVGVVSTTIKKAVHEGGNIVIVDNEDTSDVIMDMRDSLEKTTNLVNAIDTNLKEMTKEDGQAQVAGSLDVGGTLSVRYDPVVCKKEFDETMKSTANQISILEQNTESSISTLETNLTNKINDVDTKASKALQNKIRTVSSIPEDAENGDYFFVEQGGSNTSAMSLQKNEYRLPVQVSTQSISISHSKDEISILNNNKQNLSIL